jgi:hypothetical protein
MTNRSVSISPPSLASAKHVAPSAAARTKLLLEGPILPTLLRLAAPNVLNLLAFAFDGFFLGRIGTNALAGASLAFPWVTKAFKAVCCSSVNWHELPSWPKFLNPAMPCL